MQQWVMHGTHTFEIAHVDQQRDIRLDAIEA
jgi:hypothetical protein